MMAHNTNLVEIHAFEKIKIMEMYSYQKKKHEDKNYEKYLNYLNYYYKIAHKKDKYKKEEEDGKLILTDAKKKVVITPAEFININTYYTQLKEERNAILTNISLIIESPSNITDKNRQDFEKYKKKYTTLQEQINDIEEIQVAYTQESEKMEIEKINKGYELEKFFHKRNDFYTSLQMIPMNLKNKLIQLFKENRNKIPSLATINKIAKENGISSAEIEKWFKWVEATYFYILVQNEIHELEKKEVAFFNEHRKRMSEFIIYKPIVEGEIQNKK